MASKSVTAVRFWSLSDVTRVAVEVTGEFEFESDRAPNPSRLFFDLKDTRPRLGKRGVYTVRVEDPRLKQIRVALSRPGVTRVVFDLETDVDFTASQLSNPDRLIIEIRPAGPPLNMPEPIPAPPVVTSTSTAPPPSIAAAIEPSKPPAERTAVREAEKAARQTISDKASTPKPARIPRNSDASLTRVLGLKLGRIVIDAGHGGSDTGTEGPTGLLEKDLVLDIAGRLGALIESRMGSEVIYTRTDDIFVPLEDRPQLANAKKADLFLSIHANSSPLRSSSGIETYYLNFTSSRDALDVAARENASSQKTVYELRDLVQQIAMKDKLEESRAFAARVQTELHSFSVKANSRSRNRGVKKAPFVVLIGAEMPSILAEIGFLSNPRDEALMKKNDYRQKLAEALYRGISQYAATLSSFQVAQK